MTNKDRLNKNKFIVKAKRRHGKKYGYSLVSYKTRATIIKIICAEHGIFKTTPINHLHGFICPVCKRPKKEKEPKCNLLGSKGEIAIMDYLNINNVNLIFQKRFKDCKNKSALPFDFYLPDNNICIEFDGKQHFEPIDFFGGKNALQHNKINDKIKNDYCKTNSIKLIRISYLDFKNINQILRNNIKEISK